jgi:hypothetical protein
MERLSIKVENFLEKLDEIVFKAILAKDIGLTDDTLLILKIGKDKFDKRYDQFFDKLLTLPSAELQEKVNETLKMVPEERCQRARSFIDEGIKSGVKRNAEINALLSQNR